MKYEIVEINYNHILNYIENYKKKPHISRFKEEMINYERECKLKRIIK